MLAVSLSTCVVRKAGVTDPEGSAGLLRAMETRSLPDRKREEAEISRALGFLLLRGEPLARPLLSGVVELCGLTLPRCPDDRFRGSELGSVCVVL